MLLALHVAPDLLNQELDRANHVLGTMNVNYIMSLDQDGGGIDRFEFVTGMLVRLQARIEDFMWSSLFTGVV